MGDKLIRIIYLSVFWLVLVSGSAGLYFKVPSEVTIVTEGEPRDTIGIVSASRLTTLDNKAVYGVPVEIVVNAKENVEMHLSAPDDSTIMVMMRMDILDMSPVPEGGQPTGVSIELVNPSILADGLTHKSRIEVLHMKISSEHALPADSLFGADIEI